MRPPPTVRPGPRRSLQGRWRQAVYRWPSCLARPPSCGCPPASGARAYPLYYSLCACSYDHHP
eukprot:3594617-Pyramimonas_sp.AAC.1